MIIKATLVSLLLILFITIATSYYVNKEGFEDISNEYYKKLSKDLGNVVNTVSSDLSILKDSTEPSVVPSVTPSSVPKPGILPSVLPPTPSQLPSSSSSTSSSTSTTPQQSSIPSRTDVVPEVSISGSGYDAMTLQQRADLLRDIQKAVRNEILSHRATSPIINGQPTPSSQKKDSRSTEQGKEYESSCYKERERDREREREREREQNCSRDSCESCPPQPDMAQYIRKDQIPCWGCTLDY